MGIITQEDLQEAEVKDVSPAQTNVLLALGLCGLACTLVSFIIGVGAILANLAMP